MIKLFTVQIEYLKKKDSGITHRSFMGVFNVIILMVAILFLILLLISLDSEGENIYWDGGGSDHKASNPDNWMDDTAPGPDDRALFQDMSNKYCEWDIPKINTIETTIQYENGISMATDITLEYLNISYTSKFYTNGFDLTAFRIIVDGLNIHYESWGVIMCNASTTITFTYKNVLSHPSTGAGFGISRGTLLCNGEKGNEVIITGSSNHPWTLEETMIKARFTNFYHMGTLYPHLNRLDIAHCEFDFKGNNGRMQIVGCPVNAPRFDNLTFMNSMDDRGALCFQSALFIKIASNITFINNLIDVASIGAPSKYGRGFIELIDSTFDTEKTIVGEYRWIISKNHNEVQGDYKVIGNTIVNLSGIPIQNQPPHNITWKFGVNDNVDIVSGTLIINENCIAKSITIRDGAQIQINSATFTVKEGYMNGDGKVELGMYSSLVLDNSEVLIKNLMVGSGALVSIINSNMEVWNGFISNYGIIELSDSNIKLVNTTMTGNAVKYKDSRSSTLFAQYLTIHVEDQLTGNPASDELIKIIDNYGLKREIKSDQTGMASILLTEFVEKSVSIEIMTPYTIIIDTQDYYHTYFNENITLGAPVEIIAKLSTFTPTKSSDNFQPPNPNDGGITSNPNHKYITPLLLTLGCFGVLGVITYYKFRKELSVLYRAFYIKWKY